MKKRIITLLAVLALLVTCAVFAVQAESQITPADITCPCGGDTHEWTTVTQANLAETLGAIAAGGHYHITESVALDTVLTVPEGKVVVLIDNSTLTLNAGNTTHPLEFAAAAELYVIGYKGNLEFVSSTLTGGLANINAAGAALHLYGGITVQEAEASTYAAASGGLFTVTNGLVHLHASTGLSLPADAGDPALYGQDLDTTTKTCVGGIFSVPATTGQIIMDAGELHGSNVYQGGVFHSSKNAKTFVMNGGIMYGGTASNQGDAIFIGNGSFVLTGGTIQMDTVNNSGIRAVTNGSVILAGGTVKAPKTEARAIDICGSNTSYQPKLVLAGTAQITDLDGVASDDMYIITVQSAAASQYAYFRVAKDWQGEVGITYTLKSSSGTETYGYGEWLGYISDTKVYSQVGTYNAATHTFTTDSVSTLHANAKINVKSGSYTLPALSSKGKLKMPSALLLGTGTGELTWTLTANDAFNAIATSGYTNPYVRLAKNQTVTVPAGVAGVLDLNGFDATEVTLADETASLSVFNQKTKGDSYNDAYVANTDVPDVFEAPNGKLYLAAKDTEAGKTTFYEVEYKINTVSLRAREDGMYYGANIACPDMTLVDNWGVAVTVAETPTDVLQDYLYTENAYTGVLVNNIVGTEDQMNRVNMDVRARAYVTINGETYMSDAVSYSLLDLVNLIIEKGAYEDAEKPAVYENFKALYDKLDVICPDALTDLPNGNEE